MKPSAGRVRSLADSIKSPQSTQVVQLVASDNVLATLRVPFSAAHGVRRIRLAEWSIGKIEAATLDPTLRVEYSVAVIKQSSMNLFVSQIFS
jgi:hypothetical protein